jgi:hypothetical protein
MAKKATVKSVAGGTLELEGKGTYRIQGDSIIVAPDSQKSKTGVQASFPTVELTATYQSEETKAKVAELLALIDLDYAAYLELVDAGTITPNANVPPHMRVA